MSREEFLKRIFTIPVRFITKLTPYLLLILAVWAALGVYQPWEVENRGDALLLLVALVLIALWIGYRYVKKHYGEQIWNSLPPFVQRIALGLRVVVLLLAAAFVLLVGLSMPIFLALVCVHLWIDNYKLREALEKKEIQFAKG